MEKTGMDLIIPPLLIRERPPRLLLHPTRGIRTETLIREPIPPRNLPPGILVRRLTPTSLPLRDCKPVRGQAGLILQELGTR